MPSKSGPVWAVIITYTFSKTKDAKLQTDLVVDSGQIFLVLNQHISVIGITTINLNS